MRRLLLAGVAAVALAIPAAAQSHDLPPLPKMDTAPPPEIKREPPPEPKPFWQIDWSDSKNQLMLALGVGSIVLAKVVFRKMQE